MSHTTPSPAEQRGWRYRWCNWEIVCPRCIRRLLNKHAGLRTQQSGWAMGQKWPVPIDYNIRPIKDTDRCTDCQRIAGMDDDPPLQTMDITVLPNERVPIEPGDLITITGYHEQIANPAWRWWTFWRPRQIDGDLILWRVI